MAGVRLNGADCLYAGTYPSIVSLPHTPITSTHECLVLLTWLLLLEKVRARCLIHVELFTIGTICKCIFNLRFVQSRCGHSLHASRSQRQMHTSNRVKRWGNEQRRRACCAWRIFNEVGVAHVTHAFTHAAFTKSHNAKIRSSRDSQMLIGI